MCGNFTLFVEDFALFGVVEQLFTLFVEDFTLFVVDFTLCVVDFTLSFTHVLPCCFRLAYSTQYLSPVSRMCVCAYFYITSGI